VNVPDLGLFPSKNLSYNNCKKTCREKYLRGGGGRERERQF